MNKVIVYFLIILLLTACTTEIQRTISPVSIVSPMPTSTIFSQSAVGPTNISAPRSISTETSTPTLEPVHLAEDAVVSSCAAKERTWYTKHLSATYYVNDQWVVVVCSDDGIYTKVMNKTLNIIWKIPAVYDNSNKFPSWYWIPFLWSPDGKYLYMKPVCLCFIDSPWLIYASGYGLSRLNLNSGQLDVWLIPSDNPWYIFAFSDDVKLFAFTPPDFYRTIKVRNLVTGEERNINFKGKYNILEYRWTPDNSRLVVFTEEYVDNLSENGFSVFVYSLKNDALIKLLDKNNLNFTFPTDKYIEPRMAISDLTNESLKLSDVYGENEFQISIRSGEVVSMPENVTPTS